MQKVCWTKRGARQRGESVRKHFTTTIFALLFLVGSASAQEVKLEPGWFSLDGSIGVVDKEIAEAKAALEKILGIHISGLFDVSYTWSSNRPGHRFNGDISGRYFDRDHNKVVFNAFNLTLEKPEKDWGVGFKLVGDFGRTGELLREATYYGVNKLPGAGNGGEPSAELREAFLTTTIPIGAGLQVKGGLFLAPIGMELIPTPGAYQENISRAFIPNLNSYPLRNLGTQFSYPVHKAVTVSFGVVTGWDNPHDNNRQPSFLGGITFTPTDAFSLSSAFIAGPEQPGKTGHHRAVVSHVATMKPVDPLTLFVEYTWGNDGSLGGHWQGASAIASYNWTSRFYTALRGEVFHDKGGSRGGVPRLTLGEITLTAGYKLTSQLLGRLEVRPDWSNKKFFAERNNGFDKSQTTLAWQVIYGF